MRIKDKISYGSDQDSLNYWISNRNKISDLYKSEKKFFLEKIKTMYPYSFVKWQVEELVIH